jgi:NADH-quinone oxidoreductase subunit N
MNFSDLLSRVVNDTVGISPLGDLKRVLSGQQPTFMDGSLLMFLPELVVAGTILVLLLVRLLDLDKRIPGQAVALIGSTIAVLLAVVQFMAIQNFKGANPTDVFERQTLFSGLLVYDAFSVFFKVFLLLFLQLVVYLTRLTGIPDRDDAPDFYTLLFGSTIGMLLLISSNNLLMLFLGIEMTSVPSYAMVGFLKGRRTSSEAAFKYVVYGAGAAGVMLYGISLLAGLLGTGSFDELAPRLAMIITATPLKMDPTLMTLLLSIVMILVGIAFKLSVFPFHFWCPDAFEGAAAEVGGYLSVASKGAVFAVLLRFLLALVGVKELDPSKLSPLFLYLGLGLGVIAAVTVTFGNLAAYSQTNIKRMLAYSTIAHAGYMLMAVSAMMVALNAVDKVTDPGVRLTLSIDAVAGLLFYLWVYMFMNLGAFAIVAIIRNELYSEEIADYGGLLTQSPVLAISMACCLFSLVGLPPFGGFFGKFMIFSSLLQTGPIHWVMYAVLGIGAMNSAVSLFYYIQVLRVMFVEPAKEGARRVKLEFSSGTGLFVACLAAVVLLTGIFPDPLQRAAQSVATVLFP